ncbi:hypothetical protein [Bradyrhizobium sp. S3.5.5]|uniref:hypothetical protein n=1 Tax=Bradyrhizobium sp. S3.5.5 TaxID=3156430 RepID=UPI0033918D9C
MLTPSEFQTLAQLVFEKLGVNPSSDEISVWVGRQAVWQLPTANKVIQVAEWIVTTVLDQPTPDDLIRVIRSADNQQPGFKSLLDLATRLQREPGAWVPARKGGLDDWTITADPLTVGDGEPFLDRLKFRQFLPRIGQDLTMPKCMLVTGDSGSGKSYLQDFCKSFAASRKDFAVGYTKLGSSGLQDFSPRIPSMDLANGLRPDMSKVPAFHADQHRDAKDLASWITTFTPQRAVPALAILDDFGATTLNEAVHTFVLELVRLVQKDEMAARRIRIVLLGYDPKRLTDAKLQYDTHILEHVDTEHIDEWLRLRFPDQPDYRYRSAVEELEELIPERGPTRMRMLNIWVNLVSAKFKPAGP